MKIFSIAVAVLVIAVGIYVKDIGGAVVALVLFGGAALVLSGAQGGMI